MKKEERHLFLHGQHLWSDINIAPERTTVPGGQALKRTFDIVFSLSVLVLSAPLLLVMATAALCSRRPVFLLEQRNGRDGKTFSLLSLDTRYPGNTGPGQPRDSKDPGLATRNILKVSGLDKLPLFFNVLRGDMSVIGPPLLFPAELEGSLPEAFGGPDDLPKFKPGIISPGHVAGGHSVGPEAKVRQLRCDIAYLKHYSIRSDLGLLFKAALVNMTAKRE
jgi:putative colanic acid biosynthesis UDP-glucose lipid carrier transferase